MGPDRRSFIKFIVAGSVAAGCPLELALAAPTQPQVDGEHNEICHQVRDGHRFPRPIASATPDAVIVGGGMSGLSAAYFLRDLDFLLLEKEDHWGGNAYLEEYGGQAFATGAAYTEKPGEGWDLSREIGIEPLPIANADGTILKGEFIPDTWRGGIDRLPYPASVRESFRRFRREMLRIDLNKRMRELDAIPLTDLLAGYAPEIKTWWDGYGPSNWGARAADTSAFVALDDLQSFASENGGDDRYTFPGGLGAITKRLSEILLAGHRERMLGGATTVHVEQDRLGVTVTYAHAGQIKAVRAKAVIMATPKFITRRLVAGLPEAQSKAMGKIRYAPYPVVNLVFDKPVFNRGYDTWCPGNTFTDFIVADWVVRNKPGYRQKNNILTCYTPLQASERARLLTEDGCRRIAASVLHDFQKLFPGSNVNPVEVHIYRRGHPMFMATPGTYTDAIPAARTPMDRIFFANTDSEGPESLTRGAIAAAQRCVQGVKRVLKGKGALKL